MMSLSHVQIAQITLCSIGVCLCVIAPVVYFFLRRGESAKVNLAGVRTLRPNARDESSLAAADEYAKALRQARDSSSLPGESRR